MHIIIDTDQNLVQISEQLARAITLVREKFGWDGVAHVVEAPVVQLALSDWAAKAPESIGRLKRIQRAIAGPP